MKCTARSWQCAPLVRSSSHNEISAVKLIIPQKTEMKRIRKPTPLVVITAAGLCFVLLPLIVGLTRPEQLVSWNQPIQFDDFAFSVVDVRKTKTLGDRTAQGTYLVVRLKIENRALRVNYQFDPMIAVLVDDRGNEHHYSSDGQAVLDGSANPGQRCGGPLAPKTSCTTDLVFDVPADDQNPRMRLWGGGVLGLVDDFLYGKRRIKLQ